MAAVARQDLPAVVLDWDTALLPWLRNSLIPVAQLSQYVATAALELLL